MKTTAMILEIDDDGFLLVSADERQEFVRNVAVLAIGDFLTLRDLLGNEIVRIEWRGNRGLNNARLD